MGPVTSLNKQIITQDHTEKVFCILLCAQEMGKNRSKVHCIRPLRKKYCCTIHRKKILFLEFVVVRQKQVKIF